MTSAQILIAFAFILLPINDALAEVIHVISVADTSDRTIGSGAAGNQGRLASLTQDVTTLMQMGIDPININGSATGSKTFSCKAIKDAVDGLSVGPDDIVIFYYSGHGFRRPAETSRFPSFYCGADVYTSVAPSLESIAQKLVSKKPRLVIAIARHMQRRSFAASSPFAGFLVRRDPAATRDRV